jgi:hypothetical protein
MWCQVERIWYQQNMKTVLIMQLMSLGDLVERQLNFSGTPESERCRIYCDSTLITINRAQQTGSCSWLTTRALQK